MIKASEFSALILFLLASIDVAEFVFEERFHLFGAELATAEHAIVPHLAVKIHFTIMAFGAGYIFVFRFEHLSTITFLSPERLL
jgi:hypothetical protein